MINFFQYQGQGYLDFLLPSQADVGSIDATIYSSNGSVVSSSVEYTSSSVDTQVQAYVSGGVSFFNVDDPSGIQRGKRYLLDGSEEFGGEFVTVKSLGSGGRVNLFRPTIYSHLSESTFQGTQVKVLISGSSTQTVGQHFYCTLAYETASEVQERLHKSFHVTRFVPVTNLSIEDLRDFDPQLGKKGLAGTHFNNLVENAWEMILSRVGARGNAGGLVGSIDLTVPHSYLVRRLILENDPERKEQADAMSQRFNEEFEASMSVASHDANGDGAINPNERFRNTIRIARA
jgi:hypothetical protein